jgi:hypothetical protein
MTITFACVMPFEAKAGSAGDVQPDVGFVEVGLAAGVEHDRAQLVVAVGHLESEETDAVIQPLEVLIELEYLPVVDADPLEEAVSVQVGVVRRADDC